MASSSRKQRERGERKRMSLASLFALFVALFDFLWRRPVGQLVDTSLGAYEEYIKSVVREAFNLTARIIDGACALFLSIIDTEHSSRLRGNWRDSGWRQWWRNPPSSTFNAILSAGEPGPEAFPNPLDSYPLIEGDVATPTFLPLPPAALAQQNDLAQEQSQSQPQPAPSAASQTPPSAPAQPPTFFARLRGYFVPSRSKKPAQPRPTPPQSRRPPTSPLSPSHGPRSSFQGPATSPLPPGRSGRMRRIGSELFDFPGGGADPSIRGDRSGLMEDLRDLLEQGIHWTFETARKALRILTLTGVEGKGRRGASRRTQPRVKRLIRRKSDPALATRLADEQEGAGTEEETEKELRRRREGEAGPSSFIPPPLQALRPRAEDDEDSLGYDSDALPSPTGRREEDPSPLPSGLRVKRPPQLQVFGRSRSTAILHGRKGLREEFEGTDTPSTRTPRASTPSSSSPSSLPPGPAPPLLRAPSTQGGGGEATEEFIRRAGYPYDVHLVTTNDGYVLRLERIPRPGSHKVALFIHGVMDTALGWVATASGPTGSMAFAAYDQGYDVFLGNTRSNPPRINLHPDKQGARFWQYSIDDMGIEDLGAQVDCIHVIKCGELGTVPLTPQPPLQTRFAAAFPGAQGPGGTTQVKRRANAKPEGAEGGAAGSAASTRRSSHAAAAGAGIPPAAYTLQAVGHSLGCAMLLGYVLDRRMRKIPHRISRLILLTPAGFHAVLPWRKFLVANAIMKLWPLICRMGQLLVGERNFGGGIYLPTGLLRHAVSKLAVDVSTQLPSAGSLLRAMVSIGMFGGDTSKWDRALLLPHYRREAMPAVSFHTLLHITQLHLSGKFQRFDYGKKENLRRYGQASPIDLAAHYRLLDCKVDLLAGRRDGIINIRDCLQHFEEMSSAGCQVTMRVFDYGHVDFTLAGKEDLLRYVISKLNE